MPHPPTYAARLRDRVLEAARLREVEHHNLDRIAWITIPASEPATLDYFMEDYVGHLEHHLNQIWSMT